MFAYFLVVIKKSSSKKIYSNLFRKTLNLLYIINMNRSSNTQAIILNLKTLGENNFNVTILSPNLGISYATLYGGPKSKMRSLVSQFNSGKIWLYENPEKKQTKITDFEVENYHHSFSQNLFKMYAASLVAELAIKTHCGGSNKQCFTLVKGFYDGMELCNEEQSKLGLVRFLWRYLEILGIQPQTNICGSCGRSFLNSEIESNTFSHYNVFENYFICPFCGSEKTDKQIKTNTVRYLAAISVLSPQEARKLKIDKETYEQIKNIIFFLIENSIEQKLNSIEIGMGIL